jgi:hypothetical protein
MNHTRLVGYAVLAVFIAAMSSQAFAASPPGVLGAQSREVSRGVEPARTSMVKVGDPKKAEAIGLPGLKKGDPVELTRGADGKWTARDPATGNSVVLDKKPKLGR